MTSVVSYWVHKAEVAKPRWAASTGEGSQSSSSAACSCPSGTSLMLAIPELNRETTWVKTKQRVQLDKNKTKTSRLDQPSSSHSHTSIWEAIQGTTQHIGAHTLQTSQALPHKLHLHAGWSVCAVRAESAQLHTQSITERCQRPSWSPPVRDDLSH